MKNTIYSLLMALICQFAIAQSQIIQPIPNFTEPLNYVGAGQDVYAYPGETVRLYGNGASSYLWQPSIGLSNDTTAQPFVTVTVTTTYTLTYTIGNDRRQYKSIATVYVIESSLSVASCTNWVNNGDLENTGLPCPTNTQAIVSPGWQNDNPYTTTDYYNTCNSAAPFGVPNEIAGAETPHSGSGFAGLVAYSPPSHIWFEYLQQKLICPLTYGQNYNVSFYAAWGDRTNFACANIGALLTNSPPPYINNDQIIASPQVDGTAGSNSNWQQFSSTIPGNGEQWITIGNFDAVSSCPRVQNSGSNFDLDYNYIDDIVIVPVPPTLSTSVGTQTICLGLSQTTFNLIESGSPAANCTWYGPGNVVIGTGGTVTVSLTTPGVYTYTCSVYLGCSFCTTITNTISIVVKNLTAGTPLVATISPNPICANTSTNLGTVGADVVGAPTLTSYVWGPSLSSYNSPYYNVGHILQPPGIYTYSVTTGACSGIGSATFTVNPYPVFNVSGSSPSICYGINTATLTASDPSYSYTWTPATGLSATSGSSVIADPSSSSLYAVAHIYTVKTENSFGCTNTHTISVSTSIPPNVQISKLTNGGICADNHSTYTLTAYATGSGIGGNDIWNPTGQTGSTITVNPSSTTTYTLIETTAAGCSAQAVTTITVNPNPTVTISASSTSICTGTSPTLTAYSSPTSTATTYVWANWNSHANPFTPPTLPANITAYTFTVTANENGCSGKATITVAINPLPVKPSIGGGICINETSVLTITNSAVGETYVWAAPSGENISCNNSPSCNSETIYNAAGTYTVIATDANGCISPPATITAKPAPNVFISHSNLGVDCANSPKTFTLSATMSSGTNNTFNWSTGATSNSITATPGTTTSYTVTGVSGTTGCSNEAVYTITVTPNPILSINAAHVCKGSFTTLTASSSPSGPSNFTWQGYGSNGVNENNNPFYVGLHTTETYTLQGTVNGCPGNPVTITLTPLQPTITIASSQPAICIGNNTVTLTANGGVSYTWTPSTSLNISTGATVIATPTNVPASYMVTGTDNNGCNAIANITLTALPQPTLSVTSNTNVICTQDYGTVTLSATGNGSSFNWSPSTNLSCNACANPTASPTTTTIYSVTTTDPNTGCISATATTTVLVEKCSCNNGVSIPATTTLITNATLNAGVVHSINQNVNVSGNVTLTNKVLYFAPAVKFIVTAGQSLTLNHCHLLVCSDMWQGIVVAPGATLTINNNSMVEDAIEAVNCSNWNQAASSNTLTVDGCVFNRNKTGISVNNYAFAQSFPSTIRNAVFTSRILNTSVTATNWSTTNATPANLKVNALPSTSLVPAYALANTTTYPQANMKVPNQSYYSYYGIYLNNVGSNAGSFPSALTYNDITIGEGTNASYLNLFDNLYYGIFASTSNFTCVNNAFELMQVYPTTLCFKCPNNGLSQAGTAIYGGNSNVASNGYTRAQIIYPGYAPNTNPGIIANGMPAYNNLFFDCGKAVFLNGYTEVHIAGTDIRSTQSINDAFTPFYPFVKGSYGLSVNSPVSTYNYMRYNRLTNINNGILFSLSTLPASGSQTLPYQNLNSVNADYNLITANFGNTPTTQYVNNAIAIDNTINCYSTAGIDNCALSPRITISNNTIEQAYRGIEMTNWHGGDGTPLIYDNYITLVENSANTSMTHFGINSNYVSNIGIYNNNILGPKTTNLSIRGVLTIDNFDPSITCNSVYNVGKGFEFEGPTPGVFGSSWVVATNWSANTMNLNQQGFVLTNNAVLGDQGSYPTGSPAVSTVCDNQWIGSWAGPNYGTYVDANSSANLNRLFVRSTGQPYFPQNNGSFTNNSDYLHTNSIIVPPAPFGTESGPSSCPSLPGTGCNNCRSSNTALFEKAVQDSIPYVALTSENNFKTKLKLFRVMQADSSLDDSSAILHNFFIINQNTSLNIIGSIESKLAQGNISAAKNLNNSFSPAGTIETSYKNFYTAYINYSSGNYGAGDSALLSTLANACPAIYGDVVYQARVLYNHVYNMYQYYENTCNYDSIYQSPVALQRIAKQQALSNGANQNTFLVYPNPGTGKVYISGFNANKKTSPIEVTDITGQLVYKQENNIVDSTVELNLVLTNGVYFIHVPDANGLIKVYKIIINY